jgi:transcriptional regulator with XRE-family HTH domain
MSTNRRAATSRRSLAEQLRDLITDRGLSGYGLAKATGLNRSVVNRFLAGGGLTLETLDAIAAALGLKLVESGRRLSKRAPNIRREIPDPEPEP